MRKVLAALGLVLALVAFTICASIADIPTVQISMIIANTGPTQVIQLTGQMTCSVVTSTASGSPTYAIIPQASSDFPASTDGTWTTVTTIGGGSISAAGTNNGSIAAYGITGFRLNVNTISGGTVKVVYSCSPAFTPAAAGTVQISPIPLPVQQATQFPYAAPYSLLVCPSAAPAASNSTYDATCDSNGNMNVNVKNVPVVVPSIGATPLPVTTPAPAPTVATYLQPTAMLVCPSTAPVASNSTYIATCDQNGRQNVIPYGYNAIQPIYAPGYRNAGAYKVAISATTAPFVPTTPSGADRLYVVAYDLYIVSGTTPGFKFQDSSVAACTSGQADITGQFGGIAAAVGQRFNMAAPGGSALFATSPGDVLCLLPTGTTPTIQGYITIVEAP